MNKKTRDIQIKQYFDQKRELQEYLLAFIENTNDFYDSFTNLKQYIESNGICKKLKEFVDLLKLILHISNNHHRYQGFFDKIFEILKYLKDPLKQTFSNLFIFEFFYSNQIILLFLYENDFITYSHDIFTFYLQEESDEKIIRYYLFFSKEMRGKIPDENINKIKNILFSINPNYSLNYDLIRHEGENDGYLATIIRQDSIEKFISFVNERNYNLSSEIESSIFETNLYLIENTPSLIEYAAFFGSNQIFRYLHMKKVEINGKIWLFAVHSNNAELIQYLMDNKIEPDDQNYADAFLESIKCHHNEIADFIKENFLIENVISNLGEKIVSVAFDCYNYLYFPNDLSKDFGLFYLCKYNHELVLPFLKLKIKEIKKRKKNKIFLFDLFNFI